MASLPRIGAISTITVAELAVGVATAPDDGTRSVRQAKIERIESRFELLPIDSAVARAYVQIFAIGRNPRGRRSFDLLIAATALASALPLYTSNPADLDGLESLVEIVAVTPAS